MGKVRDMAMGRIRIRVTVGVIHGVCGVVRKSIAKKVLVSVLAILFSSSIGIGIGNTFCQSIGMVLAILLTSIVNNPACSRRTVPASRSACPTGQPMPNEQSLITVNIRSTRRKKII